MSQVWSGVNNWIWHTAPPPPPLLPLPLIRYHPHNTSGNLFINCLIYQTLMWSANKEFYWNVSIGVDVSNIVIEICNKYCNSFTLSCLRKVNKPLSWILQQKDQESRQKCFEPRQKFVHSRVVGLSFKWHNVIHNELYITSFFTSGKSSRVKYW